MAVDEGDEARLAEIFTVMRPALDERQWRRLLGAEARARGHGGIRLVARAAGVSATTVAAGAREIEAELAGGAGPLPAGRARRPGGGRRRAEEKDPGLRDALLGLVEASARGDPQSPLRWTTLSLRDLERAMAAAGHPVRKDAIARILHAEGFSLQGASRTIEGAQHEDRDAQFAHINAVIAGFAASGDPVASADCKKKEQLGPYYRPGRSWRPKGDPVRVRDHDFADYAAGRAVPYGIYDIAANRGFVCVGASHDTGAFAAAAIRRWWAEEGSLRYPGARRLLLTVDAGGSNGARCWLWKDGLARLAAEAGIAITACHFPPGTSKWNKIEHRLFCHVTRAWRGRPLMTIQDAVAGIAATVTGEGLKCTAALDAADYPVGQEVPAERIRYLEDRILDRHPFHGEWNYTVLPAPRPAPEQQPEPARPGRVPASVLNHPALTGMDPADVEALAAALAVPFQAYREQQGYLRRGGPRSHALYNGTGITAQRRLHVIDHVLALRLRQHLQLPNRPVADLLGVHPSAVSHAISDATRLIRDHGIPLPPAAPPPSPPASPEELTAYATANGVPLAIPETSHSMPYRFKPYRPRNREAPNLKTDAS